MLTDRRSFLQTSVMSGCAAATGETVLRKADSLSSEQGPALIERMSWRNVAMPSSCAARTPSPSPGLFSAKRESRSRRPVRRKRGEILGFAHFRR